MDGKRMRRKEKAMETRARIQRCALELFEKNGYDNVSMREIAEAAHASIGSIYHHFKGKEEITAQVTELLDGACCAFYEELKRREQEEGAGAAGMLKRFFVYVQKTCAQYGNIRNFLIYRLRNPDPGLRPAAASRELCRIYGELLIRCREEGSVGPEADLDEIMTLLVQAGCGMTAEWLMCSQTFDLERQAGRWFDVIMEAAGR